MRIAQIAPLTESVPPQLYGGTERVVSYLTEALVDAGHEVTLFASGDSQTSARLIPICPQAIRLDQRARDPLALNTLQVEKVASMADDFDIIHTHTDFQGYSVFHRMGVPFVTTLHGRLDLPDLPGIYRVFDTAPVVSISNAQRVPLPFANWIETIYHGLPDSMYPFSPGPGGYLAFLGRASQEKRVDRAIEIAIKSGVPLKIAAKIDKVDVEYFREKVAPLLDHPLVEFIGEIGEQEKAGFLGGARALLFPIDWPEPFGLVLIEAMACGTPIIAYPHGSVPEIIVPGENGFLVNGVDEAVDAVNRLDQASRARCRSQFESRFSVTKMVNGYVDVYSRVMGSQRTTPDGERLNVSMAA